MNVIHFDGIIKCKCKHMEYLQKGGKNMLDIAKEIIIQRAKKEWTQQQFADKLKTTQRTVAAWESGDSIPRKAMKVRIAQIFDLPEDYFLTEDDFKERSVKEEIYESDTDQLLRQFDGILSNSKQFISEEKKHRCLEAIQEILEK